MRRLGGAVARPPHYPLHALDKSITVVQFVELLAGQLKPRLLDKHRKPLG